MILYCVLTCSRGGLFGTGIVHSDIERTEYAPTKTVATIETGQIFGLAESTTSYICRRKIRYGTLLLRLVNTQGSVNPFPGSQKKWTKGGIRRTSGIGKKSYLRSSTRSSEHIHHTQSSHHREVLRHTDCRAVGTKAIFRQTAPVALCSLSALW